MLNRNNIGFFVDKVSEDSFYHNLLLGISNVLDKFPNIYDKKLERYPPATNSQVENWERSNGVSFPQDLHDLYLSCNGLLYTYIFNYEPTNREDVNYNKLNANIEINPIENLNLIQGYEIKRTAKIFHQAFFYKLELCPDSKVFELSDNGYFKVTIVYPDSKLLPTVWIYKDRIFYFIANDVTTYLRMAIAHLGVPGWQFIFTPLVMPGRSREMLNIIAPSVLHRNLASQDKTEELNKINPTLFETVTGNMHEIQQCNDSLTNKQVSEQNTIGRESSSVTVGRKSSTNTIGRKASSLISSYSQRLKKKSICKRRPFTPRF